jgi:hypothetical protein
VPQLRREFDTRLLELFEHACNPIIAWEIGALVAARSLWHREVQETIVKWLDQANWEEWPDRAIYLFKRLPPMVRERCAEKVQKGFLSKKSEVTVDFARGNGQWSTRDFFRERLVCSIVAERCKTSDDWMRIVEPYLSEAAAGDTSSYPVLLTIPALLHFPSSPDERLRACKQMLVIVADIPYLAQPALQWLVESIVEMHTSFNDLEWALDLVDKRQTFNGDEWGRFILVRVFGALLRRHASITPTTIADTCRRKLRECLDSSEERLTIVSAAYFGLRGED